MLFYVRLSTESPANQDSKAFFAKFRTEDII